VRDCDASAAWYASVLGFEEAFREESAARRACVMRFPGSNSGVGLVEHTATAPGDTFDPERLGLDHLAFTVASQEALEAYAEQLAAAGVESSGPFFSPTGGILNFKDPDGVALAAFWDRD
jgi:glyoxylase I family protein